MLTELCFFSILCKHYHRGFGLNPPQEHVSSPRRFRLEGSSVFLSKNNIKNRPNLKDQFIKPISDAKLQVLCELDWEEVWVPFLKRIYPHFLVYDHAGHLTFQTFATISWCLMLGTFGFSKVLNCCSMCWKGDRCSLNDWLYCSTLPPMVAGGTARWMASVSNTNDVKTEGRFPPSFVSFISRSWCLVNVTLASRYK